MMTLEATLEAMKQEVKAAGFTPSAGSWEDETRIIAFSVESHGRATFGHPKFSLRYDKATGQAYRENTPYALKGGK